MNWKIGICDDVPEWMEKAGHLVKNCMEQKQKQAEVFLFPNGNELLAEESNRMHMVFLDIEMPEENGIALAARINQKWPECQIIYMTNYWSYAMDVYETRHIYYMMKEKFEEKLPEVLDRAMEQLQKQKQRIIFQCHGGVKVNLKLDEILYFERDRRVTYIITQEQKYTVGEKIPEIEARIASDDFIRCHNSFLINLSYVKECMRTKMLMENGKVIDISRGYWKKTEEAYVEWMRRWAT